MWRLTKSGHQRSRRNILPDVSKVVLTLPILLGRVVSALLVGDTSTHIGAALLP